MKEKTCRECKWCKKPEEVNYKFDNHTYTRYTEDNEYYCYYEPAPILLEFRPMICNKFKEEKK
jgi:hypothetical protein